MKQTSLIARARIWLALAFLLSFGFALAQSEPSINQIYATAQAGKLDEAQVMVQQVLVTHPKSPKAHFVQSELYARQGNFSRAREALAQAESLAPGLPFAKPEAVQALRAELAPRSAPPTSHRAVVQERAPAEPASSFAWGLPLLLAGGVIFLGYLMFRRRPPAAYAQEPAYAGRRTAWRARKPSAWVAARCSRPTASRVTVNRAMARRREPAWADASWAAWPPAWPWAPA